jgi:DNA repair exonuclease SbcCD nuclease subunit
MSIRILHTADVHIGAKLAFLGSKSEEQRRQINTTFGSICDLALSRKANLFLIAGDMFDNPFPSKSNILFVAENLKELTDAGIYVAVIPGNHDLLEPGSVFTRDYFKDLPQEKLHIFNSGQSEAWQIAELECVIYGRGTSENKTRKSPLEGIAKLSTKFQIGLFHGSVDILPEVDNLPIPKTEIAKLGFDYLALGDWHSTLDVSQGKHKAFYSGSPELVNSGQFGSGNVLMVELETGSCKVEQVAVGMRKAIKLQVDLAKFAGFSELGAELAKRKDKDAVLSLELTGLRKLSGGFDSFELQQFLGQYFYFVNIADHSQLQLDAETLNQFPEETIKGKFIRILQKQKGKDEHENLLLDEAIQLGLKFLSDEAD